MKTRKELKEVEISLEGKEDNQGENERKIIYGNEKYTSSI